MRKRWFVLIVSAFAVLALVAAWYGAPPPAKKAEEGYVDEEAVGVARQGSAYHSAFRRQLGDTPDAAWALLQPNMSAALSAAADGWAEALEGALATRHAELVEDWYILLRSRAEAVARERRLLGARRKSAAAKAVDQLRRPLACQLRLLQLAADFAAGWAAQQSWQSRQHPPVSNSAAAAQEQQARLVDVQLRAGNAHLWLLAAHSMLAWASSSVAQELIATLAVEVAVEACIQAAGLALGRRARRGS